jgi:cell division protein FtsL
MNWTGIKDRLGRIGIVPTLLLALLLSVAVAVAVVQTWTLLIVGAAEKQAARVRLDVNLALLEA